MKTIRTAVLIFATGALGGCAVLDDLMSGGRGPAAVPLDKRAVEQPIDANVFTLSGPMQRIIGEPQVVFTSEEDTFSDLARTYGLGYDELVAANPGVDPWLPGAGTAVLLPTQFVIPAVEPRGVVLNIAAKRLFYFPLHVAGEPRQVLTYPIGIGRVGWETPLGATEVIAKAKDPSWWVPASVRQEHAEMGDPLPAVVPPGPDNPLGHRVLKLDMPGYLIHGTNQPYGVGMRVSHGCVRLYPENIEYLYRLVDIGEPVMIVNEPYLAAVEDGVLFFEAHEPLEDDAVQPQERLSSLLDAQQDGIGRPLADHIREHIETLAAVPSGVPLRVTMYDADEILERVRVVENVVERDRNEPTLEEVRQMISELDTEQPSGGPADVSGRNNAEN